MFNLLPFKVFYYSGSYKLSFYDRVPTIFLVPKGAVNQKRMKNTGLDRIKSSPFYKYFTLIKYKLPSLSVDFKNHQ